MGLILILWPPTRRGADVETLVASFDAVAFDGRPSSRVRKWAAPISIALIGVETKRWRPLIAHAAETYAALTGLDISVVDDDRAPWANLRVHLGLRASMVAVLSSYDRASGVARHETLVALSERTGCAGQFFVDGGDEIVEAMNFLSTDYGADYVRVCALQELFHNMGLWYHSAAFRPSVASGEDYATEPAPTDRIMLRTLYDTRLRPGMTRKEALPIARAIIGELVAEAAARAD